MADKDDSPRDVPPQRGIRPGRAIAPTGAIGVLTLPRGQAGYVAQEAFSQDDPAWGRVDHKACRVSEIRGDHRFVVAKAGRP